MPKKRKETKGKITSLGMPGVDDSGVGILIKVTFVDGNSEVNLLTAENSKQYKGEFSYGLFPTKLMVLLIAAKNKLQYRKPGHGTKAVSENIASVALLGLFIPKGVHPAQVLTYSTLPFVYINDNALGGHHTMPIYDTITHTSLAGDMQIGLDRNSGNFYMEAADINDFNADADGFKVTEIKNREFDDMILTYNHDFLRSGFGPQDLIHQIINSIIPKHGLPQKGQVASELLKLIADRWFRNAQSDTVNHLKDFNIGAMVFIEGQGSGGDKVIKILATSLNEKSVNRAAHAEVRLAVVFDFINAAGKNGDALDTSPLKTEQREILDAYHILTQEKARNKPNNLGLIGSLLPCYMCLGNIESTIGGFIVAINNRPVDLYASFPGLDGTLLISDTDYYDVDSAIDYRDIDIYEHEASGTYLVATVKPLNITEHFPPNVELVSTIDRTISALPRSVENAGSTVFGIGLQNNKSMFRYMLAAEAFKLVQGSSVGLNEI